MRKGNSENQEEQSVKTSDLLGCPFCGAIPSKFGGDENYCYVRHKKNCFINKLYGFDVDIVWIKDNEITSWQNREA